jgi:hypothetical protein
MLRSGSKALSLGPRRPSSNSPKPPSWPAPGPPILDRSRSPMPTAPPPFRTAPPQAIEEAIARGLPRVEAGAQGEHKMQRGYLPNYTYRSGGGPCSQAGQAGAGGGVFCEGRVAPSRPAGRLMPWPAPSVLPRLLPPWPARPPHPCCPSPPRSAHYCRDPVLASAVGRFLEREAQQVRRVAPAPPRSAPGCRAAGARFPIQRAARRGPLGAGELVVLASCSGWRAARSAAGCANAPAGSPGKGARHPLIQPRFPPPLP